MKQQEIIKIIEPFAYEAKFISSKGPGYLRKKDWKALRNLHESLSRNSQSQTLGGYRGIENSI